MTPTYEEALAAVEARNLRPVKSGGGVKCLCPVHGGNSKALNLTRGADGSALFFCHGRERCSFESIVSALGLSNGDGTRKSATVHNFKARAQQPEDLGPVVASYEYHDEHGGLLFAVDRYEPTGKKKTFRQRRPDGRGGWIKNTDGARLVLYALPAVLDAMANGATVYVVEGEKDADRINALEDFKGAATCNPMGAGKWRPEYAESLRGAHVVVVADRDDAGRKHAQDVARSLAVAAASVQIVEAKVGKDTHDHLQGGHSLAELVPVGKAEPEPAPTTTKLPATVLVGMASVVPKMPVYLAGSIVRATGLHLWWSCPGHLKTYLAILLVLEMTQKKAGDLLFGLLGFEIVRPWRKVVWLGDEETAAEWKARANAVARGHGLREPGDEVQFADASGGPCILNLDHVPRLIEMAGEDVDAVFADPLANLGPDTDLDGRPVKVDLDNPHALRRVCRPLRRLAKQREIAVYLLHHANSTGGRERGPTAYRGSADVVAELKYDSDVLTLIDGKNRDRTKGRFSFQPVWEGAGDNLSVRFDLAKEPVPTAASGLTGTARLMFVAAQAGAGKVTHADLMAAKYPGKGTEDVSSRTKRRAWAELLNARLVCEDGGVVRLVSTMTGQDTGGHEVDT